MWFLPAEQKAHRKSDLFQRPAEWGQPLLGYHFDYVVLIEHFRWFMLVYLSKDSINAVNLRLQMSECIWRWFIEMHAVGKSVSVERPWRDVLTLLCWQAFNWCVCVCVRNQELSLLVRQHHPVGSHLWWQLIRFEVQRKWFSPEVWKIKALRKERYCIVSGQRSAFV